MSDRVDEKSWRIGVVGLGDSAYDDQGCTTAAFQWTEEKFRLYVRASVCTGFHARLAAIIAPKLDESDHLLDLGCGPGLIDLALAARVQRITACDVEARVLDYLRGEAARQQIGNLHVVKANVFEMTDMACDAALLCYFGAEETFLKRVLTAARKKAIVVTHGGNPDEETAGFPGCTPKSGMQQESDLMHLSTGSNPCGFSSRRPVAADMDAFLKREGRAFRRIDAKLDFSQPFKSEAEAWRCFELYSKEVDPEKRRFAITAKMAALLPTGDERYPLRFPIEKSVAVYEIPCGACGQSF